MVDVNAKVFRAVSVAGGEENNMTLAQARDQVEAWESSGYSSYVEHMYDPTWEDVKVTAPITPQQVAESLGHDREALEDFAFNLAELLGWELEERQHGGYLIDTSKAV